jgi:hypothetical protein
MPYIRLDDSFARDGQVVVAVGKEEADLFCDLVSAIHFPGGERLRVNRRHHETSVDEIFSVVRDSLGVKEACKKGTLKNERQAVHAVALLQSAPKKDFYADEYESLGFPPPPPDVAEQVVAKSQGKSRSNTPSRTLDSPRFSLPTRLSLIHPRHYMSIPRQSMDIRMRMLQ